MEEPFINTKYLKWYHYLWFVVPVAGFLIPYIIAKEEEEKFSKGLGNQ